jgi:hypothetical protein
LKTNILVLGAFFLISSVSLLMFSGLAIQQGAVMLKNDSLWSEEEIAQHSRLLAPTRTTFCSGFSDDKLEEVDLAR